MGGPYDPAGAAPTTKPCDAKGWPAVKARGKGRTQTLDQAALLHHQTGWHGMRPLAEGDFQVLDVYICNNGSPIIITWLLGLSCMLPFVAPRLLGQQSAFYQFGFYNTVYYRVLGLLFYKQRKYHTACTKPTPFTAYSVPSC